jgi:hypothetical protein
MVATGDQDIDVSSKVVKKRPARFGSVGRGVAAGVGRDTPLGQRTHLDVGDKRKKTKEVSSSRALLSDCIIDA